MDTGAIIAEFPDFMTVSDPEALAVLNDILVTLYDLRDILQAVYHWIVLIILLGVAAVVAYLVCKPLFYFIHR